MRDLVYISYAHADKVVHRELRQVLDRDPRVAKLIWDDTKLQPGDDWRKQIDKHVARARIMIMLVSSDYLSKGGGGQKRCSAWDCEIEQAFEASKAGDLTILWLPLSSISVDGTPFSKRMSAHDLSQPLDSMSPTERHAANLIAAVSATSRPSSLSRSRQAIAVSPSARCAKYSLDSS